MNGFNTVFLSHFDDYVIIYKHFIPTKPDPSVFNVEGILTVTYVNYLHFDKLSE